jgi:hypothetical protein
MERRRLGGLTNCRQDAGVTLKSAKGLVEWRKK